MQAESSGRPWIPGLRSAEGCSGDPSDSHRHTTAVKPVGCTRSPGCGDREKTTARERAPRVITEPRRGSEKGLPGRRQEKRWEARFPGSRGRPGEERDPPSQRPPPSRVPGRRWSRGRGPQRAAGPPSCSRGRWCSEVVGSLRPAAPYVSVTRPVWREVTSENVFLDSDLSTF